MRKLAVLLILLLSSLPTEAEAEENCNDPHLVVNTEILWDYQANPLTAISLPTLRNDHFIPTRAVAKLDVPAANELNLWFEFPAPPGETVGLEYNIYEIKLRAGAASDPDQQNIRLDFTENCSQVGPSMFPGGKILLPTFTLAPHVDGKPRGKEPLLVQIWGHR